MASTIQDEFDRIITKQTTTPPEDDSDESLSEKEEEEEASTPENGGKPPQSSSRSIQVPRTVFNANTGPKGVIADAQAFERARRTTGYKNEAVSGEGSAADEEEEEDEEKEKEKEEDCFMRQWRESRMRELQSMKPTTTPRPKLYGFFQDVDAEGYLDAIEKAPLGTSVVVCIYDPSVCLFFPLFGTLYLTVVYMKSTESAIVEDALSTICKRQPTTRFVKIHCDIADMDYIEAPALLAYKSGNVFAVMVDILESIPKGCNADSLEDLLRL